MTSKRDRRQTLQSTSLALDKQKSIDDYWTDATLPDNVELKADTASVLSGEGTTARIISNKEKRKQIKNNYRVPVLNPDGTPAMPTTSRRANKWIKEGKAKKIRNKLGIFQIQLLVEPSAKNKQNIVTTVDPGSAFTGVAVVSKKAVLYGAMLELPGYKKGSEPKIVTNKQGKKIEKYPNLVVERMDKRRQLRRGRRYRKTRRRPSKFLNRSKSKLSSSTLARKQLELKVVKELSKIYPISGIGFEDVKFSHFKDINGTKGQFFSHVEIGKNWIFERLKDIAPLTIVRGYETNNRRKQLELKKGEDKTERNVESHVNDCISMGSILLGDVETTNKFKFDVITKPKYSRRFLHLEQFSKRGVRRKYGGTTSSWTNLRKGDYVEAVMGKKVFRGWVSGYMDTERLISVSNFDWNRLGQFSEGNVKLLNKNNGLLLKSKEIFMTREELFNKQTGTRQGSIWEF